MTIAHINSAEPIDTLVIGAGLGGIQSGAVHAMHHKRTLVIDKSSERSYRDTSPSQGSLRGLRTISQPDSLKKAITDSTSFFKKIQTSDKPILYYPNAPYLMCVKDKPVAQSLTQDLKRFHSTSQSANGRYSFRKRPPTTPPYSTHSVDQAPKQFGIYPPHNYNIVNVTKSGATRLNIDNLFDHCKKKINDAGGSVLYGHQVTDYAKLRNGKYYVEISSRNHTKHYIVNDLVVAAGTGTPAALNNLSRLHAANSASHAIVDNKPLTVPSVLAKDNSFAVPQRTLYIKLPEDVKLNVLRNGRPKFGALYMLDVDDDVTLSQSSKLPKGRLGCYCFFEKIDDPTSDSGNKIWGMKVGYDPMPFKPGMNSRISEQNRLFAQQEGLMFGFLNRIFNTRGFNRSLVVDRATCEYPLTVAHHPIITKSASAHDVTLVAGLQGYGAMSVAGAVETVLSNQSLSSQWSARRSSKRTFDKLYTDNSDKAGQFLKKMRMRLEESFQSPAQSSQR